MKKNQIASIPRRKAIERGAVALLLLLYVLLQAPTLPNAPWEGYDTWRQGDTYSVAVNYAQYSMHPLRPQFNYDGTADIVVQLELQLVPYLSALLFQLTGPTPLVPRLLGLVCFLGSAAFLYGILRRFVSFLPALGGLLVYLLLPICLLYSRAIMPESCALFFYCGGVYFLLRWFQDGHGPSLYCSALFTALGIMEKTPVLFVGLLVLAVFWWKLGKGCLKAKGFYGYGLLSLGLPFLYYTYASQVATISFVDGIATKHIFSTKILGLFTREGLAFFWRELPLFFGWGVLLAGAVGFALALYKRAHFLSVWALAFALEWATIVVVIQFGYYLIFMAPPLAALCALLFQSLFAQRRALGLACAALVVALTAYTGLPRWHQLTQVNQDIQAVGALIQATTQKGDVLAVAWADPVYINAADRHGFRVLLPEGGAPDPAADLQSRRDQGADYFVVIGAGIPQDDGRYQAYLDQHCPVAAENGLCTIYEMR
ncbi:MAG: hypothetical protein HFE98_09105 [Ruminiclostridium sp.]|nr:hypothetical protein [Ruminiclostridium sp.]